MDFKIFTSFACLLWSVLLHQSESILPTCTFHNLKLDNVLTVQFPGDGSEQYTGGADDCLIVKAANLQGKATRVKLQVQYFDVEHHYLCQKDYLEIRDGWSENSNLIGKWCGVKTDETIESSRNYMFLKVVTDDENFARGFKLQLSTTSDSVSQDEKSESVDPVVIVPICIGIVVFAISIVVICVAFFILPRRKKRQRAAERQARNNPTSQQSTVEMVHVTGPTNGQVVGEPVKPPSYTCALRGNDPRPEIPSVAKIVPSAPPPTYTYAIRDPPQRPSTTTLYPNLDTATS